MAKKNEMSLEEFKTKIKIPELQEIIELAENEGIPCIETSEYEYEEFEKENCQPITKENVKNLRF